MNDLKLYARNEDLESLLSKVKRFTDGIGIQFGLEKCELYSRNPHK